MRTIDAAAQYPEGPLWHGGALYYVEYGAHRIARWRDGTKTGFWAEAGCGPCALGAWQSGILLCAYDANALVHIAPDGRTRRRLDRDEGGRGFVGPNDLTDDGIGGFFFTASGVFDTSAPADGAVLHIDAHGTIRRLADGLHYPNGIAFDIAQRRVYVSEHLQGRIVTFDVATDGTLENRQPFCNLRTVADHPLADGYAGGDGMEFHPDGRLLVAHFGTGRLLALAPDGGLERAVDLPLRYPTNLARHPETGIVAITAVADPWNAPHGGALFHLDRDLLD